MSKKWKLSYAVNNTDIKIILFDRNATVSEILDIIQKKEKDGEYKHLFYEGAEIAPYENFVDYYEPSTVYIASKTSKIPDELYENKSVNIDTESEDDSAEISEPENEQIIVDVPQINIEDYEITEYIAQGGFASVFKAIDKNSKKEVAIKAYSVKNSIEEIKIYNRGVNVSCADVPCLVKTIGYRFPLTEEEKKKSKCIKIKLPGQKEPFDLSGYLIVTEYYKHHFISRSINDYLNSKGIKNDIINPTVRSKIIFGVASIMKQLHEKNIIYRDLKLENVLLTDDLEPMIFDFEFSKFVINPLNMTMSIGTPISMAPELFMDGDDTYLFPVDVYAYGILLYKMFSNDLRFKDNRPIRSSQQFMMKIGRGNRPARKENIPDVYWELIQQCWKQDPNDRLTFDEIVEILRNDKYALEEFGMRTDLDELHRYQDKMEG